MESRRTSTGGCAHQIHPGALERDIESGFRGHMKRRLVGFLTKEHRRRSMNYHDAVTCLRAAPPPFEAGDRIRVHKRNTGATLPKLSILLVDWHCRQRLHTFDGL